MDPTDLEAWRKRMGFNQIEAAAALGIVAQSYRNWERGRRRIPKLLADSLARAERDKLAGIQAMELEYNGRITTTHLNGRSTES